MDQCQQSYEAPKLDTQIGFQNGKGLKQFRSIPHYAERNPLKDSRSTMVFELTYLDVRSGLICRMA